MGRETKDEHDRGGQGQCNCFDSFLKFITCHLRRLLEWGLLSHLSPTRFISITLLYDILTCHCLKIEIESRVGTKKAENELFSFLISRLSGPKIAI